jgi:hypothetical protein
MHFSTIHRELVYALYAFQWYTHYLSIITHLRFSFSIDTSFFTPYVTNGFQISTAHKGTKNRFIGERAARAQCLVLSIEIFDTYVYTYQ